MNKYTNEPQWCFPESAGKGNTGINANMPDSFRENPWDSLIRECCQNALDASDNDKTVILEFHLFTLPTDKIPGILDLKKHINSCNEITQRKSQFNAKQIFERAVKELKKDELICLRISDFNTTGLRGSRLKENADNDSQWINCVRSTGSSGGKNLGSAGSQGLGKATTFLNSAIRTVFFNTLDIDKNEASEGVSQLISHYISKEKNLDGTGYFGCTQDNQKCRAFYFQNSLDPNFYRKTPGTDIFILALNQQGTVFANLDSVIESFDTVVKNVIVDSFLPAIRDNKIIIRTSRTKINKTTLPEIMNYLSSDNVPKNRQKTAINTVNYNAVMNSEVKPVIFNTDKLGVEGQLELKLLVQDGLNRRIAIYREVGMKIKEMRKNTPFEFSGTLTIKGDQLNLLMKNMETTNHGKWQENVYSAGGKEQKLAKSVLTKMKEFIDQELKNYIENEQSEQMDSGLGDLLPDTSDPLANHGKDDIGLFQLEDSQGNDFIEHRVHVKKNKTKSTKKNTSTKLEEDKNGDIKDEEFTVPVISKTRLNKRKITTPYPYRSLLDDEVDGSLEKSSKYILKNIELSDKKMIPLDSTGQRFLVIFTPNIGAKNAKVSFKINAEVKDYRMPILSASDDGQNLQIENQETIVGLRLYKNKEYHMEINLPNNSFKSFLVKVYAYKSK